MVSGESEMHRISTGVQYLDRTLNGGLPEGTITSVVSPPASQCNPLFYSLMRDRPWLYVTTYRSEEAVLDELERAVIADTHIKRVGLDDPIEATKRALDRVDAPRHVLVDTLNPLEETDREIEYVALLNALKDYLRTNGCLAVVHCTEHDQPPQLRETTLTVSDVVWELELVSDDTTVETRLRVPKYRCTEAIDEVITLDLGQDVRVDTSRNIV